MPTLIVFPSVFKPSERVVHNVGHGVDIAQYAAEHYQNKSYELYLNGNKVDSGIIADGDVAAIIIKPAAPVAAAIAAYVTWQTVATIVISLAVSYIISSLFKPKTPSFQTSTGDPSPSPVYSITAQQNSARLGAPIPVIYGEVIAVPDYASQPILEYVSNEQYLYAIFCLGQGHHEVTDMIIGETSSKGIPTSVADYRVYQPDQHNGNFGFIEADFGIPENVFMNPEVSDQQLVPPDRVSAGMTHVIGDFDMCRPDQTGNEAAIDIIFPNGLFTAVAGGGLGIHGCTITIKFTPIDALGNVTGAVISHTEQFVLATNTPHRRTFKYALPTGRYRASVQRDSPASVLASQSDTVVWGGLKFKLTPPTHKVYGNVTLIAVKIKASNGISGGSSGRIRFKAARKLIPLNKTTLEKTRNPVDALVDMVSAKYGADRPYNNNEFDISELTRSHTKWNGHNGFNGVFDKPTTVWEAMVLALQPVAAVPLPMGSQISIAHDCIKNYRMAMFTDNNMVANTISIQYEFSKIGDPSGVKVEYRDPIGFEPAYVNLPDDRDDLTHIKLFGCTDKDVAMQHAQLQMNRVRLQRKSIAFETELEGLSVRYGDRIAVSHSMPSWGQSAEVVRYVGDTLILNKAIDWSGSNHVLLMRDKMGVPHTITNMTQGGKENEIIVKNLPFTPEWAEGELEPTMVAFGTADKVVTDWIVTTMEPKDEYRIAIGAIAYDPAIYNGAMPHQLIDDTPDPIA